ncbi:hypothetical protein L1987_15787 [Smallanthus sonchifolius]|uniref:Uncharacterized protein n=1 Tax=Smallanthus sonchifolius TaxID=185202 RepID=A0ACB9J6J6_9ASTR|nr:hypothetical protein L1987_15787 [Smallanthus sonchifolius]
MPPVALSWSSASPNMMPKYVNGSSRDIKTEFITSEIHPQSFGISAWYFQPNNYLSAAVKDTIAVGNALCADVRECVMRYFARNGLHSVGAHTNSPCLKLKPVSEVLTNGYLEVGVNTYGGGSWHTWFDSDLMLVGRMIIQEGQGDCASYSHQLVRIQEPIMRIPTLAIHLARGVNGGFTMNVQCYLDFVLATSVHTKLFQVFADNDPEEKPNDSPYTGSNQQHHFLLWQLLARALYAYFAQGEHISFSKAHSLNGANEVNHASCFKKYSFAKMWFEWNEYCCHHDFEIATISVAD